MASDASRRWLDNSGIWSCRIKLPSNNSRSNENGSNATTQPVNPTIMDLPLVSSSPSARRNQEKLAEAIKSMHKLNSNSMDSLDLPTDPDAQATVTDFLDFTEYLASDINRSFTLIQKLDQSYADASATVNELTKKYGSLPNLPLSERADPVALRAEISESLGDAVGARTSAHAEATRMAENVERHYNRVKNILAKLQDMQEKFPSSRETSPVVEKKKATAVKPPKITLRLGGDKGPKVRKHRAPRITVPGEVLAPYELDYDTYVTSSDESEDEAPRATPARGSAAPPKIIKLKVSKPKKDKEKTEKTEKTSAPKPVRPPGQPGTNAHSAVAGISTTNALALLEPPPPDAENGSDHRPWLQLTPWELANLRKRMKKNAVWLPSDTMINRELKSLGRGMDHYQKARQKAEESGVPWKQSTPPQIRGETVNAEGAISVEAVKLHSTESVNKGMKLNEAKKLKKENEAKEAKAAAKLATEAMEMSARKANEAAKALSLSLNKPSPKKVSAAKTPNKPSAKVAAKAGPSKAAVTSDTSTKAAPPVKATPAASHKRKREESVGETEVETPGPAPETPKPETLKPIRPLIKRTKTETPIPVPVPVSRRNTPSLSTTTSVVSEPPASSSASTPIEATATPLPPVVSAPTKVTPILPPGSKKVVKKDPPKQAPTAAITRPQRTTTAKAPTPVPEPQPSSSKRPTSSRSNADQATATLDRPRRASTARNTPAPPAAEARQQKTRPKRPAPGVVTPASEGSSTSVTVNKRKATTRKKTSSKKEKKEGSVVPEVYDEIDDEGNIIDPDEPRYCICNRVSFGVMIGCENNDCEKEWFHLECVDLTEIPPRTTKWYCPECRVTLGIGEKGVVNARGKKQ